MFFQIAFILIVNLCNFSPIPESYSFDDLSKINKYAQNVVAINLKNREEDLDSGFGFIFGEQNDSLLIITSYHLFEQYKYFNDFTIDIFLEFFNDDSNTFYEANFTGIIDAKLDLAILSVTKPLDFNWNDEFICKEYHVGEKVWYIGRNRDWYIPCDKEIGRITTYKDSSSNFINVNIKGVLPGTSGAPLLTLHGAIGMIILYDGSSAFAVPINQIRNFICQNGFPWELKVSSIYE